MPIVASWTDYQGRTVELSDHGWVHILEGHVEMADRLGEIARTIEAPNLVVRDPDIRRIEHHYGVPKGRLRVQVVVLYRPTPEGWVGEVVTAHRTRRLEKGEHLWP
jgi:hypothetical protein